LISTATDISITGDQMAKRLTENGIFILFYRIIFPAVTIIALLFVPRIISMPAVGGNIIADFIIRLFLCFIFCDMYFESLDIEGKIWKFFHIRHWKKEEIASDEKNIYIFMAVLYGLSFGVITYITLYLFLPVQSILMMIIAVLNGFIIGIPCVLQYEAFKI
jgi:hypothetical protein